MTFDDLIQQFPKTKRKKYLQAMLKVFANPKTGDNRAWYVMQVERLLRENENPTSSNN